VNKDKGIIQARIRGGRDSEMNMDKNGESSTPRRLRNDGMRSSISYSPATRTGGFFRSLDEKSSIVEVDDDEKTRSGRAREATEREKSVEGRRESNDRMKAMTLSEE